jgi:hypothetical protein
MGIDEEVLPEPFSEKNIDGTPLSGPDPGGSLFKSASSDLDRRRGERRQTDRRNIPYQPQMTYQSGNSGEQNIYSSEAARREADRASSMSFNDGYGQASSYAQTSTNAASQIPTIPVASQPQPAARTTDPIPQPAPAATVTATIRSSDDDYGYSIPDSGAGHDDYGYSGSGVSRVAEETRFEPPVDEKPGMIPNPMKMPPVKVKSSLDYDYDYDSDIGVDAGYDYDYDTDDSSAGFDSFGSASFGSDSFGSDSFETGSAASEPSGFSSFGSGSSGSDISDDDDYGSFDVGADDDYGMDVDIDDDDDYR